MKMRFKSYHFIAMKSAKKKIKKLAFTMIKESLIFTNKTTRFWGKNEMKRF